MRVTDALLGEHGLIYALFAHVDAALARAATVDAARVLAGVVDVALRSHAQLEDELLFPMLEAKIGPMGPLAVMREEHREIEEALDDASGATEVSEIVAAIRRAIDIARPHFQKEEVVLFPLASRAIPAAELDRLGAQWAKLRHVDC
jgi:iron-sulfur cluster repair protein YtfE (RIC family)